MYVIREDMEILCQKEVRKLREAYEEKFGEDFIPFNYRDFHWDGDKPAAAFYVEALREALEKEEPTQYEKDPFGFFGH